MAIIKLLKLNHIDNTYNNVMDFTSISSRDNYFDTKVQKTFTLNITDDSILTSITLPINHTEIYHCNYLYITDEKNKKLFYFILNYEHKTPTNTILTLQLDVFTTYQFDFTLLPSYVERCHVARWNGDQPTLNTIDEGLPINEYILDNTQTITSYNDGLIIASTQPLGVCEGFKNPSEGNGSTGDPTDGNPSKSGFRFIKGYEAFSPQGLYLNNENFKTVGYGSTETSNIDYYNAHKPFPCSEQKASEIFAERYTKDFGAKVYSACETSNIASKITLNMFDAMVSLSYNCGYYGFTEWETSPWHLIKLNPFDPNIETTWHNFAITSNGVELEGLKLRRKAEYNIYKSAIYEVRPILIYEDGGNLVGVPSGEVVTDNRGDGFIPDYLPDLKPTIEIIMEV